MLASIIIDSDSLHEYRYQISHVIDELKVQIGKTESAIEKVGETWKDDNFKEFQNNFNEDKEEILPLCKILENYESNILLQLEQKVKKIEYRSFRI